MGRFDTIKTTIDANIKENGSQEITGQKMNAILTEMVNATDAELTELESDTTDVESAISAPIMGEEMTSLSTEQGYLNNVGGINASTLWKTSKYDVAGCNVVFLTGTSSKAGAALAAVPIIIVFITFQKYFTQGITMGAVKG